ncbi:UNVERIFIED_CONTAM: hypothetical protein GTU68_049399, partial [Idotea baltica]|nr:hypothetical protein [Idotea baltica]
ISRDKKLFYINKIKNLIIKKKACLISHYYVDEDIQRLTEESGGLLGDSLAMANFGKNATSDVLIVCGVRFMGETAKILSPQKTILMPTLQTECSLDISCNFKDFFNFISQHPDRTVVVYVNTSAKIKSLADWTVTSSNALEICSYLKTCQKKILWAPDKYLGGWIQKQTLADIRTYSGFCVVHDEFKSHALKKLKDRYKNAIVLAHPESPEEVLNLADIVGSTSRLLRASQELNNKLFIVATDNRIFYKMKKHSPTKIFIEAPTNDMTSSCTTCSHCPWMVMNNLLNLYSTIENEDNEVLLHSNVIQKSLIPLQRMLDFSTKKM